MNKQIVMFGAFIMMISLCCIVGKAQPHLHSDSITAFAGVWKGISSCQVKASPCHDETVVYHISTSNKTDIVQIQMNKIVNGEEEEMGVLNCLYDYKKAHLISMSSPDAVWTFKRSANGMEGTLYFRMALYRLVHVAKQVE